MMDEDELANRAIDRLSAETALPRNLFQYEIQDDGELLLIVVDSDDLSDAQLIPIVRRIAEILRALMPVRVDDYSWVVCFERAGTVVESCFGGNSAIADWDGEQFVESCS